MNNQNVALFPMTSSLNWNMKSKRLLEKMYHSNPNLSYEYFSCFWFVWCVQVVDFAKVFFLFEFLFEVVIFVILHFPGKKIKNSKKFVTIFPGVK